MVPVVVIIKSDYMHYVIVFVLNDIVETKITTIIIVEKTEN